MSFVPARLLTERRSYHCGLLPESEWTPCSLPHDQHRCAIPASFGDVPYELNVCPGFIRSSPALNEGGLAARALRKNALHTVFAEEENAIVEAALIVDAAWDRYDAWEIERNKPKPTQ